MHKSRQPSLYNILVPVEIITTWCMIQKQEYSSLWPIQAVCHSKWSLRTKQHPFESEASIKMSWKRLSHPVVLHFVFNLGRQLPAIASSLLFLPDQAKQGVGSTWALSSRLPPISRHLPAWYQSTLYSHPTEKQPTLKETEGDVVWWRNGVHDRGRKGGMMETEIEAQNERRQEGSSLLSILNLPHCSGTPSSSTLALSKDLCPHWALTGTRAIKVQ